MIEVVNYTKQIKNAVILKNINLRFEPGRVYGLQGRNGSGKTMLMRAICGLIRPTEGYVSIDGKRLGKELSFPPSVGVLIENPDFLDNRTGLRNLELIASIKNIVVREELRKVLTEVGLDPDDRRKYRKYSLGMKQKLGIAAAVMEEPDLLILDEPLNALDADGVERVHRLLERAKSRGATIIIACHDREELELLSDVIIKIEGGEIVSE